MPSSDWLILSHSPISIFPSPFSSHISASSWALDIKACWPGDHSQLWAIWVLRHRSVPPPRYSAFTPSTCNHDQAAMPAFSQDFSTADQSSSLGSWAAPAAFTRAPKACCSSVVSSGRAIGNSSAGCPWKFLRAQHLNSREKFPKLPGRLRIINFRATPV